ncbi:hypothetical protein [Photobacterium lutimaris]|uniref:Glycoamylase-like domain-containing protein n=1 Tax=Photobacterium lutimaris TaxID=388278 RepID=A0A2T3IYZ1_9GAMM|nr:hypothetical protein [Photobacterium lutimaris]PSU33858.1 hypothetical protein C9I99_10825 [Photobacterium lutimaris]TDR76183.1 hypothetical protein DFP78_103178 [Photobacterium lutimaris]
MKKKLAALLVGTMLLPGIAFAETAKVAPVISETVKSDQEIIDSLYRGGYAYWQQLRNENGTYEDKLFLNGDRSYIGSIANSGMGLVALTIGHANGWEPEAEQLALQTLRKLAGQDPNFTVPQNATNTFIHFYNTQTGEAVGDDWSPVDSAIMIYGALFVKNYFSENEEIAKLADFLFSNTDLTPYIADVKTGRIYLAQHTDGTFKPYRTKAFNEYMLVAGLANQQAYDLDSAANAANAKKFWDIWYSSTKYLPVAKYNDIPVLSEGKTWFTSQFNFLFNNYLMHDFSNNPQFVKALENSAKADFAFWRDVDVEGVELKDYEWGSGAGSCPNGYCVDRFHFEGDRQFNHNLVVSPHILAGYIPFNDRAKDDLISTYRDNTINAKHELDGGYEILWRYSHDQPDWKAEFIEGVDFSTFLFGMAAMPEHLGMEFFNKYNNYFE